MQQLAKITPAPGGESVAKALFLEYANIVLNRGYAFRQKEKLDLTHLEFNALSTLLLNKGRVVFYDKLRHAIIGDCLDKNFDMNKFIDDLIVCMRNKLGEPNVIQTFHAGYGIGISSLPLEYGDITLELFTKQARRDGKIINLRRKEFDLLACIISNAGRIVSREELLQVATARKFLNPDFIIGSNVLDVYMSCLRKKLGVDQVLETHRSLGYAVGVNKSAITRPRSCPFPAVPTVPTVPTVPPTLRYESAFV